MAYDAGEAFIRFTPSFQGMVEAVSAQARRDGDAYVRIFQEQLRRSDPSIRPDVDSTRATADIEALRRRLAELSGNVRIDLNAGSTAAQLATIAAATNRLTDSQGRLSAAQENLRAVSARAGVTETELAAATQRVARAERDQEVAALRLAAAQQAAAAAAQRAADNQRNAAERAAAAEARAAAAAERTAAAQQRAAAAQQRAAERAAAAEAKQRASAFSLRSVLITLAPAVIPLAGAAAAGGGALAAMGVAGVLAIKGIKTEMKAGTELGKQYTATINTGKSALATLEQTASRNLLGGFQSSVSKLNSDLPAFNVTVGESARHLGDIGAHVAGGLVSGFTTFAPLISKVETEVDHLAGRFETWASGPGGAHFAQTLSDDFDQAVPVIGHLVEAVGRVVAAFAPAGGVILHEIDALSSAIDHIPVPVLQAAATAFVAIKSAALVSGGIGLLAGKLSGSAESAALLGGRLGFVGAALTRISPYAAAIVGIHFAADAAATATERWRTSTNDVEYALAETFKAGKQLFSGDFKGLWSTLFGTGDDKARDFAINFDNSIKQVIDLTGKASGGFNDYTSATIKDGKVVYSTLDTITGKWADLTRQQQRSLEYRTAFGAGNARLGQQTAAFGASIGNQSLTDLPSLYTQEATALTKVNDANLKAITTGKSLAETYHGVKITQEAVAGVMQKYGLNTAAAVGFLEAQVDVYRKGAAAADRYAAVSKRITDDVAGAEAKYKLTGDQVNLYAAALGITGRQLANGAVTQGQFNDRIEQAARSIAEGDVSISAWVTDVATFTSGVDTAATRATLLGQTMVALQGDTLGYANTMVGAATANQKLVTDFNNLGSGVVNLRKGYIDYHNAGAAPVLKDLQDLQTAAMNAAAATYQHEVRTLGAKQASKDAADVFRNDTYGALVDQAKQLGITDKQAKTLADRYFHWPKNAKTLLETLGQDKVTSVLGQILRQLQILNGFTARPTVSTNVDYSGINDFENRLNRIAGRHVYAHVNTNTGAADGPGSALGSRSWTKDGKLPPGVSTVGERGYEAAITDRYGRTEILSHEQTVAMGIAPGRITGYAGGTGPGESGGFAGVTPIQGGGPGSTAASKAEAKAATDAKQALQAASQALTAFEQAVGITRNAIKGAERDLLSAAKAAGASSRELAGLRRVGDRMASTFNHLNDVQARLGSAPTRPTAYDNLAAVKGQYKDLRDSIISAVTGSFALAAAGQRDSSYADAVKQGVLGSFSLPGVAATPVTTSLAGLPGVYTSSTASKVAGSDILSSLVSSERSANTFVSTLKRLRSEGLPQGLLDQLAQAGPSALPQAQALLAMTPKALASVGSTYRNLAKDSAALSGTSVTFGSIYGEAKQAATDARTFAHDLRKLADEGLSPALVAQLAAAGPSALPQVQALLQATPRQLRSLNHQVDALKSTGGGLGTTAATDLYGAGVKAAQGIVDGLKSQERELEKQMKHLADVMVGRFRKDLDIHSPSRVFHQLGSFTGLGLVGGIRQQIPNVSAAVGELMSVQQATTTIAGRATLAGRGGGPSFPMSITQLPNEDGYALAERVSSRVDFALRSR